MSDAFVIHGELPLLERPVLVVALEGWIDASGAAATAMTTLHQSMASAPLVTFDADTYLDYRARRPTMEVREGVNSRLVWPETELRLGWTAEGIAVLSLTGPEPDTQWRRFAREVAGLATRLGVYQMVAFGAYPFAAPHTRPARLSITTPSTELAAGSPFARSSVDVPAGVSSVLEHALTEAGIASIGLWVQVPHYASAMPYPAAAVSLLDGLRQLTGVNVDTATLDAEVVAQRARIDSLISANDEHATMLRQLERAHDEALEMLANEAEIPSADDLAAELERFLRDQAD